MKILKKMFISLLVVILGSLVFYGCNFGGNKGKVGVLELAGFEGGYGNTYLNALKEGYKKYNPSVTINVEMNPLVPKQAQTELEANLTKVDIFFVNGLNIGALQENKGSLADLSDLYSSKPKAGDKEESITVMEKINPEFLSAMKYNGNYEQFANKYYALPYANGPCSIVLNKTILNQILGSGNWSVPKTSNELLTLCQTIVDKNASVDVAGTKYPVSPFIFAGNAVEYWRYTYYIWLAQYSGKQAWIDMMNCKVDGKYDYNAIAPAGKLKAMEIMETILKPNSKYSHSLSLGSTNTVSQKYFMQGRACMMSVGDWIESEMKEATSYKPDMEMIKVPVISDLGEMFEGTAAEKEQKLISAIDAVDNGQTSVSGVNSDAFNKIAAARKMIFSLGNSQIAVIPEVSVNKDLAKDFLRYMYSDEGIAIMLKETGSLMPVINYTIPKEIENSFSQFQQTTMSLTNDATYIMFDFTDPIRYRAGLPEFLRAEKPEISMAKKTNTLTAKQIIDSELSVLASTWNNYIKVL